MSAEIKTIDVTCKTHGALLAFSHIYTFTSHNSMEHGAYKEPFIRNSNSTIPPSTTTKYLYTQERDAQTEREWNNNAVAVVAASSCVFFSLLLWSDSLIVAEARFYYRTKHTKKMYVSVLFFFTSVVWLLCCFKTIATYTF